MVKVAFTDVEAIVEFIRVCEEDHVDVLLGDAVEVDTIIDVVLFALEVTEVVLDQLVVFIEALVVDRLVLADDDKIDAELGFTV